MLNLIDEARAQTAAIHFLQGHQIIITEQVADLLQVVGPPAVRQQMLPAAGQVMAVAFGTDANLDIETEQAQHAIAGKIRGIRATTIDLRLMQTDRTPGTPAAQHGGLLSEQHALCR